MKIDIKYQGIHEIWIFFPKYFSLKKEGSFSIYENFYQTAF